jgi:hypothetical protein
MRYSTLTRTVPVLFALSLLLPVFANYDINRDRTAEIRWVRDIGLDRAPAGKSRGLVVVIVEPRLLRGVSATSDPAPSDLLAALRQYAVDLSRENWAVRAVAMQVYDGPIHQDGRTLLAMREYLRAVRRAAPDLAGVVIVGDFPEGYLVRQYNWRQQGPTVLHDGQPNREDFGGKEVCRLRSRAEVVGARFDLPLADLDGHWEAIYHQAPEDVPSIVAVYPDRVLPKGLSSESETLPGGPTKHYELGSDRFEDFFFVNDGKFEIKKLPDGGIDLKLLDARKNDEVGPADLERPNAMSVPQILVSRINAKHAAIVPRHDIHGVKGEGLLDARGIPQTVTFADAKSTPRGQDVWEFDPRFEQRLLIEFFSRDHRYRLGAFRRDMKPASIQYGLWSFMDDFRASRPEWKGFTDKAYDLQGDDATLAGCVDWLKRPAILRGISAHSDPWGSALKESPVKPLEAACGGQVWAWRKVDNKLVPTLGDWGKLDFPVLRTIYENKILPDTANLFLHSGCEITSPEAAANQPYNAPGYAHWQGAECLMFYCKGLALVGRSKGFYDFPNGFAKVFGEGRTFGDAWRYYFQIESSEPDIEKVGGGIGRKRAYWWNLLGDWTLTLNAAEGRHW